MGKLIRNGIEYGGGNGTDIFEVTQAEYDALVQAGTLVHNALYVITDAPNLNATAQDISYDGGADTVWDKVEGLIKYTTKNANIVSTQAYSDFRYDDVSFSEIDRSKVIGITVIGGPTNRPAFAILMDGSVTKVRVFANGYADGTSIPVRLAYLDN